MSAAETCLTANAAAVACAVYWVHPGVWWITMRLRAERELACDDRVLSAGENARARPSARAGLHAGPWRDARSGGHDGEATELEGRMLAMLDAARNRAVPACEAGSLVSPSSLR